MIQTTIILVLFVVSMLFYMKYGNGSMREGFSNYRCPNVLIQKGKDFFLFNTKLAKVPGVNPLQFSSLEDYKEFMEWQRSQGINCPVLYVQQSYDTQGNEVFQQRPNPFDLQGGLGTEPSGSMNNVDFNKLDFGEITSNNTNSNTGTNNKEEQITTLLFDASRSDPPYNKGHYPSFDPHNQYIGEFTPLDQMNVDAENEKYSADPMDPNWGGPEYSQELVHRGHYKDNEVYRYSQGR